MAVIVMIAMNLIIVVPLLIKFLVKLINNLSIPETDHEQGEIKNESLISS